MSDVFDIVDIGVQGLSPAQLAALGDSALGHAVRRVLAVSDNASAPDGGVTIAAFQDSM